MNINNLDKKIIIFTIKHKPILQTNQTELSKSADRNDNLRIISPESNMVILLQIKLIVVEGYVSTAHFTLKRKNSEA